MRELLEKCLMRVQRGRSESDGEQPPSPTHTTSQLSTVCSTARHTCNVLFVTRAQLPAREGKKPQTRMLEENSAHSMPALVMPCPGTTAETKAAPGSG